MSENIFTDKLDEMAKKLRIPGDETARLFARHFAAWCVREAATRASIMDYEPEETEKKLREMADYLDGSEIIRNRWRSW